MFKVMVVEDEPVVLSNIGEILQMTGFDCALAFDGNDAISILEACLRGESKLPGLIISDLMMPNLDGFGLLKAVKSNPGLRAIPFVILSARSDASDLKQAFLLGAEDYLVKPFEVEDLVKLASKWSDFANKGNSLSNEQADSVWIQNDLFETLTQHHSGR